VLLVLDCAPPLQAQYRFDSRSTADGLPQNSVHSILQTRDGYLWFTTFDGLVRYDGVRFTIFARAGTRGLGSNRFFTLYEAADGSLWAGTQDGGLTQYKDGTFRTYTTADGLPDNGVAAVCDDGEGGCWCGHTAASHVGVTGASPHTNCSTSTSPAATSSTATAPARSGSPARARCAG
jgi:ligand-binding sensor domain-containing protein